MVLLVACADDAVHLRPTPPSPMSARTVGAAPVWGGGLSALDDVVVVADVDGQRLVSLDPTSAEVLAVLELGVGADPGRMADDGAGQGYVVLRGTGEVVAVSPALAEVWRRPVCAAPVGIAWDDGAGVVLVACASGALVSLDAGGTIVDRRTVVPDLRDVVVSDGRTFVSVFRTAEVLELDSDGIVDRWRPADVVLVDPPAPLTAGVAWALRPRPGGVLLLHQWRTTRDLAPDEPQAYGGGGCNSIVLGGVSTIGPDGLESLAVMPNAVLAVDVALDGDDILLAMAGVTPGEGLGVLGSGFPKAPACQAPSLFGPAPDHTVAVLVHEGRTWSLGRQPLELRVDGVRVPLAGEPRDEEAFDLFHRATPGGLACASCHPEGGDDGQTWTLVGRGPRRTPSLRGTLGGTAPYHWDGEFPGLTQLLADVMVARMGGEPVTDLDAAELLVWLDGLPPARAAEPPPPDLVAHGADLFAEGCAHCHAGPRLTDSVSHDVGTGGRFQTPSLLGLSARAPFLHDGCATTLHDRFGPCGGDARHSPDLDVTRVDALVAYLETL